MAYVDVPTKKQKLFLYEKKAKKLKTDFTIKEFQKSRKLSTKKHMRKSFGRIAICLNYKIPETIPLGELDKICLIVSHTYERDDYRLGVGPLNDGYLVGVHYHRLGFKVFYFNNTNRVEFLTYLKFFLQNATQNFTLYYSGRIGSLTDLYSNETHHTLLFDQGYVRDDELHELLSEYSDTKAKIVLITDAYNGGAFWNISETDKSKLPKNVVSLSTKIEPNLLTKPHRLHGLFTFYICRLINETPDITPSRLNERISPPLNRFHETFVCETSNPALYETPLFD